jgi:hypothetical protein
MLSPVDARTLTPSQCEYDAAGVMFLLDRARHRDAHTMVPGHPDGLHRAIGRRDLDERAYLPEPLRGALLQG